MLVTSPQHLLTKLQTPAIVIFQKLFGEAHLLRVVVGEIRQCQISYLRLNHVVGHFWFVVDLINSNLRNVIFRKL